MRKNSVLDEEILLYLKQEWESSIEKFKEGAWLTARAFQLKLKERGVLISWPTLSIRLNNLNNKLDVERIKTSNGYCWKPAEDGLKL